jgi:primosomal protein N' (replication factor Y)
LVQTLAPEAPAIRHAAMHDTAGFLATELERRRALGYPPYSHLVRLEFGAPESARAQDAAETAHGRLAEVLPSDVQMLGPAPRFRLRGKHRRQLLLKAPEREGVVTAVRSVVDELAAGRTLRGISLSVDVDPQ